MTPAEKEIYDENVHRLADHLTSMIDGLIKEYLRPERLRVRQDVLATLSEQFRFYQTEDT